jgi:hypothetical protein
MCLGFTQNFAGFVVVRAFLGMAEGGLLPGMVGSPYIKVYRNFAYRIPDPVSIRVIHTSRPSLENRVVLYGSFALWGLRRLACPWLGRDWDPWRLVKLEMDLRDRRLTGKPTLLQHSCLRGELTWPRLLWHP